MPPLTTLLLFALLGFVVGVLVNLIADYLPGRRHHFDASASPFVSPEVIPPLPTFIPRRVGDPTKRLPPPLWSGIIAGLLHVELPHSARRVLVELGLASAFACIAAGYSTDASLPFFLYYGATLVLVVVVDVEHRWILWDTIWPAMVIALIEAWFIKRITLYVALQGGLYGFLILSGLYLLGIGFAQVVGMASGRRISRTVLGFGDVRLATLSGLLLGWHGLGPALLIMIVTGAIAALIFIANKMVRKRRYRRFSAMPYGPYVVIGTAAMLYMPWIGGYMFVLLLGWR